ncbi:glycoside hydrolase [Echinicola sp. CAU 1574]|uniref:Glycoside hydrolase n=1 Tax=Echinicola arenosa TaxID=2774144 RepID=A0ABR9ALR3_9BACT|nr:glycosyl hydrolase [Echinicola arenosa]MBD8489743.1 glycoside hydrolase [Echinicola arenosa]
MKLKTGLFSLSLATAIFTFSCQQNTETQTGPQIQAGSWPEISQTAKPWTRWWWMGNAVDQENLNYLLHEYADAGLGGVEIAPIYGAKGYEDRYLDFLSKPWLDMLHYTVDVADSLGMGVDLTQGTGWPFGGPFVEPHFAASKLEIKDFDFDGNGTFKADLNIINEKNPHLSPKLLAVMAYGENGKTEDITNQVAENGELSWQAAGSWKILAIYNGKTGQKVKRAAPGGQGYTLDHFAEEAIEDYLGEFDSAFNQQTPGIRSFYNDSFEVYGANFTQDFLEEFQERRGYDLKPHMPELLGKSDSEKARRIKSDYRETLHELLLEHFTQRWTDWAHNKGKLTKNQAHGSPGNLIDLYAAVDIPECETFGSSYFPIPGLRRDSADIRNVDPDPIMLKFASSAGHLAGKELISCETFTWLGEHFKSSFSQMKPEVDQAFLAGINHVFYHGVTYSPKDVDFPGWLFYASLNLTQQNSLWPHFKSFNEYIARCQSVLQAGKPDNELIMYWPVYDVWADKGNMFQMISVHHIDHWLHPTQFYEQSTTLMEQGYAVDFASDKLLAGAQVIDGKVQTTHSEASPAKALLIPAMEYLPVNTLESILALAEEGATVIFQEQPKAVPGFHQVEERKAALNKAWEQLSFDEQGIAAHGKGKVILNPEFKTALEAESIQREELADTGLQFIRRALGQDKYYFLVNHTDKPIQREIPLNINAPTISILDPLSGATGLAQSRIEGEKTMVKVHLASGQSLILQASQAAHNDIPAWKYLDTTNKQITIEGPWKLHFDQGGPELPEDQSMATIQPWTNQGDEIADQFSGQATYSSTFTIQKEEGKSYLLKLGKVHESAKIWINGKEAGYAWSLPYQLRIGEFLKDGENEIKIQVANLMANRIRYMDQQGLEWRNYHEINFVNINYKPFDASNWKVMPSGIEGPVMLEVYEE